MSNHVLEGNVPAKSKVQHSPRGSIPGAFDAFAIPGSGELGPYTLLGGEFEL